MPFNGSGVFQRVRNWVADAAAGIKIRADYHDAEDDGFATGLSNCITRDGQSLITQNIPFNSRRVTGLQDPVNPQDASTKAYADTKMSKTGDSTLTGNLTLEKDCPALILNDTDACGASITGQHVGKNRWRMYYGDGAAESTGNVGSDFTLNRYADDGTTLLDAAITINRATGLGTVLGNPTAPLGIVTKQYSDATYQTKDPQLFAGIPPVSVTANYNTIATDAQKVICNAGTSAIAIGIIGSIYPVGTVISFFAYGGITSLTNDEPMMWLGPSGPTSGNRVIAQYGVATAVKWAAGNWVISGNGLT